MILKLVTFCAALVLLFSTDTFGQSIYLSGSARDSTSFDLLPFTTIHTMKGKPLGEADENGYFSLSIKPGDTIVFTRLGYKPVKVAPKETAWDMNVLLPETVHVLDQAVIYDNYIIHGHEQIQKSIKGSGGALGSTIQNQTAAPTPASNLIPTFGAGVVINGALSNLLGTDRERRKVSANKAEIIKTQIYYEVMHSMQVKEYLKGLLNLSEDDYFKSLEKFKVDYPTASYLQSREEIVRLMVESFTVKK
jgi:hypothetical protein